LTDRVPVCIINVYTGEFNMPIVRLKKWGNSYALRIPKNLIDDLELELDSRVEIKHDRGKIVLTPIRREDALDELVAQITPENLHGAMDPGNSAGDEAW
jgi:antitoxin MazE